MKRSNVIVLFDQKEDEEQREQMIERTTDHGIYKSFIAAMNNKISMRQLALNIPV